MNQIFSNSEAEHQNEMEKLDRQHKALVKKWSIFWGFVVTGFVFLFVFLYLR